MVGYGLRELETGVEKEYIIGFPEIFNILSSRHATVGPCETRPECYS